MRTPKKCLLALALVPLTAAAARASTLTFAGFNDSGANQWNYVDGSLTASAASANFVSYGPPNQVLNFSGPVTYTVTASAAGVAVNNGGIVSQPLNGEMVFRSGATLVLDVTFAGALITGQAGSNSTSVPADTTLAGNIINFSSSPSVQVGNFIPPNSFSIALTQIPGISISGANLANFTATASGTFGEDVGGGAGAPEPSSLALLGTASLLLLRKRRRA